MLIRTHRLSCLSVSLFLGLLLQSIAARAEWREILLPHNERLYVDMSSLQRSTSLVRLNWLVDLGGKCRSAPIRRRGPRFSYCSQLFEAEYECRTKQKRQVRQTSYSEGMGKGSSIVEGEGPWTDIKGWNDAWQESFAIACNSK